jgi:hypothetical protein
MAVLPVGQSEAKNMMVCLRSALSNHLAMR